MQYDIVLLNQEGVLMINVSINDCLFYVNYFFDPVIIFFGISLFMLFFLPLVFQSKALGLSFPRSFQRLFCYFF